MPTVPVWLLLLPLLVVRWEWWVVAVWCWCGSIELVCAGWFACGGPVNALICGLLYELLSMLLVLYWRDPPRNPDGGALPYAVLLYCSIRPLLGLAIWWGAS